MSKQATIEKIAREILLVPTLKIRNSDAADFHDLHVSQIKAALEAVYEDAYMAGRRYDRD